MPDTTTRDLYRYVLFSNRPALVRMLKHLGKTEPDDEPLPIRTVVDVLGVDAARDALVHVDGCVKPALMFLNWEVHYITEVGEARPGLGIHSHMRLYLDEEARAKLTCEQISALKGAVSDAYWDVGRCATWKERTEEFLRVLDCIDAGVEPYRWGRDSDGCGIVEKAT